MTVASEITRLQGAKSDIRQAIIDKGVDVGAGLTIDQYAACIAAIQSGPKIYPLDYIIVGGGGGGSNDGTYINGGGGGCVMAGSGVFGDLNVINIGQGGECNSDGGTTTVSYSGCTYTAPGGLSNGQSGSGQPRGTGNYYGGVGGGGECGPGGASYNNHGGPGGAGLCGYGGGGGGGRSGGQYSEPGAGVDGGGNGGCNATNCGGGGGGCMWARSSAGKGGDGIVILCYKTDGSCGFSCATGGTVTTCNGYTIHTFTSDGIFTIVS